jgi:type 1 glutamine amidotransferase
MSRRVHLVTGGRWHDFDYARARLHEALASHPVEIVDEPSWPVELDPSDVLVSYTCDLRPDPAAERAFVEFVEQGGRVLALHATNSALDAPAPGGPRVFGTPDAFPAMSVVLGSRFLAHPPVAPYRVEITAPDHPLVAGIEAFETRDELYVCQLFGPLDVLLHTRFSGDCPSFPLGTVIDDDLRPVLYLRRSGAGEVVYLTLGHCRSLAELHQLGKADATEDDHGSWELPEFRTLLGRCLDRVLDGPAAG